MDNPTERGRAPAVSRTRDGQKREDGRRRLMPRSTSPLPRADIPARGSRKRKAAAEEELAGPTSRPKPRRASTATTESGSSSSSDEDSAARPSPASVAAAAVQGVGMAYPDGALRITRTPGRAGAKNCVNLGDVIHTRHLVSACIFAFFVADEELFRHLPLSRSSDDVPIYVGRDPNLDPMLDAACNRAGVAVKERGKVTRKQLDLLRPALAELHRQSYGKNLHAFNAWSPGSSHSKILLLVYGGFLRLVITSCNMMDADTELGDNHWYIHDLPRRRGSGASHSTPSGFEADLLAHLEALNTPAEFIDSISGRYDYSAVKVHLVTSVPGTHAGARAEAHGLLRLRRAVRDLGLGLEERERAGRLQLEVCAASVGNLSARWLRGFHDCALGRERLRLDEPGSGGNGASSSSSSTRGVVAVPPDLKIFYPTVEDVRRADADAQEAASNIGCHTRPWARAPDDVRRLFHRYQSRDAGRLFHQKLILATDPHSHDDDDDAGEGEGEGALPYYVYVGSANLSQSAWGALDADGRGRGREKGKGSGAAAAAACGVKLVKTANFECGVVVPGDRVPGLLEPGTAGWREGIVPFVQTTARYDLRRDKPWNDPRWVQDFRGD
ncbi:tyrosyl-DNA phosphodiesterase-domain-containing protein [Xylariaceae sp. FL0804]|nr:tyrosyl-DNA phosphodiesterase-domain-containing protein [Xylariaceae sp. FL0804]